MTEDTGFTFTPEVPDTGAEPAPETSAEPAPEQDAPAPEVPAEAPPEPPPAPGPPFAPDTAPYWLRDALNELHRRLINLGG